MKKRKKSNSFCSHRSLQYSEEEGLGEFLHGIISVAFLDLLEDAPPSYFYTVRVEHRQVVKRELRFNSSGLYSFDISYSGTSEHPIQPLNETAIEVVRTAIFPSKTLSFFWILLGQTLLSCLFVTKYGFLSIRRAAAWIFGRILSPNFVFFPWRHWRNEEWFCFAGR